jgi:hypothetical protein
VAETKKKAIRGMDGKRDVELGAGNRATRGMAQAKYYTTGK